MLLDSLSAANAPRSGWRNAIIDFMGKVLTISRLALSIRGYLSTALLLTCLLPTLAQAATPPQAYTELEWSQLVPASWQPPLIQPDPSKPDGHHVDPASLAVELQNQQVKLPGFIKPIVFEQNHVSEFLLIPFLEHHVKQHIHLHANQMV